MVDFNDILGRTIVISTVSLAPFLLLVNTLILLILAVVSLCIMLIQKPFKINRESIREQIRNNRNP